MQGDSVLMVFERDCEILGQGALPATQPDAELPCPEVPEPEDEQDCDYDDLCDSALVDFELDLKLLCDVVPEPEGEQDRAYDQLYASHLADLEDGVRVLGRPGRTSIRAPSRLLSSAQDFGM
ncbi:unnamed protein product [Prorocentrum cordatum]|uniref:Uncharacterized protein n=1 Tax=Prorocentrum cordatum TaxID=2364126 RepID=A0ABN9PG04_9DINO|nr:unnamed protein product [Polarella glacialis]